MEERVYQGFLYRRAGPGQPWQQVGPAPGAQPRQGRVFTDPNQAREQARKDAAEGRAAQDQQLQTQQFGLSQQSDARSDRKSAIDNPQALRTEYAAKPEVKAYKTAAQMAAAAMNTQATPQGDIALVYSFAKVMDPESVVRDQEANMVTNSQPWFQSAVQNAKKQFGMDGAGNFTPETRKRLRREIMAALASRKPLYDARRAEMADIAVANGIPAAQIIGRSDTEIFAPEFRKYAEKNGDQDGIIGALIGGESIKQPEAPKAAGFGATNESIPIPEAMQQAHNDYLATNWGKVDPQDYAAFRINLDKQYGFGSNPEGYAKSAAGLNQMAAQGQPMPGKIPAVEQQLSGFDQFRNSAISNPVGAAVAGGLNSAGLGIPSLFAPEQMQAIRNEYPIQSFVGDVGGGLAGTSLVGKGLGALAGRAEGTVANLLANPLTADMAYGAAYGATQAEDPLYGAVGGAASGFVGNRLGRTIGRAFPGVTGKGGAIQELDKTVPTSQALREEAAGLYADAELNGLTATPEETFALADRMGKVLSEQGVMSPTGRLSDVSTQSKDAYKLIEDYAGDVMTPKQIETVRGRIADGLSSKEPGEKRIARLLLNDFDEWTDATNPALAEGLRDARGVASRYLQGDRIALADEMADIRQSQFSNSGAGNAVRTDFRALDRNIAKGTESFTPEVEAAIREASRGTPLGNSLRNVGKFGFQHPLNAGMAIAGGGATAGPIGGAAGAGIASLGTIAQLLSNRMSGRAAQVAENSAYGGPQYVDELARLLGASADRGGHAGAVTTTELARLLADTTGY
jgi:hypothetical protein